MGFGSASTCWQDAHFLSQIIINVQEVRFFQGKNKHRILCANTQALVPASSNQPPITGPSVSQAIPCLVTHTITHTISMRKSKNQGKRKKCLYPFPALIFYLTLQPYPRISDNLIQSPSYLTLSQAFRRWMYKGKQFLFFRAPCKREIKIKIIYVYTLSCH